MQRAQLKLKQKIKKQAKLEERVEECTLVSKEETIIFARSDAVYEKVEIQKRYKSLSKQEVHYTKMYRHEPKFWKLETLRSIMMYIFWSL